MQRNKLPGRTKVHAPVFRRLDNAIHRINRDPVDKSSANTTNHAIRWIMIYLIDCVTYHLSKNPGQVYKVTIFVPGLDNERAHG